MQGYDSNMESRTKQPTNDMQQLILDTLVTWRKKIEKMTVSEAGYWVKQSQESL